METPIYDFVREYAQSKGLRLHMPGHKGIGPLGIEHLDITEIEGADVLYKADGIIKKSQKNATALFSAEKTLYSAEGSSLSIKAMLYLATIYAKSLGKRPIIAAARNAHKAFLNAAALLDFEIAWLYQKNRDNFISCKITAKELDAALSEMAQKPTAVYITSPDYLGNLADIIGLSKVCRKHNALLLVDNAHGAYLNFLSPSLHPIALGADICCDSAHKTLPVLTGGAYLHISKSAPDLISEMAENAMSLFASTSPSYLILQSLDLANRYIADGYERRLSEFIKRVDILKSNLTKAGYSLIGSEPLKITIAPKNYGYSGIQIAEVLRKNHIICEFCDPDYVVMMLTPETQADALEKLEDILLSINPKPEITEYAPPLKKPKKVLSPRVAMLCESYELEIEKCCGKVLADPAVSCPPAIPIVVCGELIDDDAINLFKYYKIEKCRVVKK